MAFSRATAPIYVKGTMDVWCHNPVSGDLDYYSNKINTNALTTTTNMGTINAGVGNPVVINIPDSATVDLAITAANMSLEARALSIGGALTYNGVVPIIESVTASSTSLTVTNTPVAPYGISKIFAFIDQDGTAYTIDATTKIVQDFTATSGQTYCVRYFMQAASAQQLTINTVFSPSIETVMCRLPAYSAQGSTANQGTLVGHYYIWIPRMQFSGKADTSGDQTTAATTDISGSALSYEAAAAAGVCVDAAQPALAYMVYMPLAGATSAVTGMVIPGGAISMATSATLQCPVKYIINDQLVQPTYTGITYSVSPSSLATVSAGGLITAGSSAGDGEITCTLTSNTAITCVANLSVTA